MSFGTSQFYDLLFLFKCKLNTHESLFFFGVAYLFNLFSPLKQGVQMLIQAKSEVSLYQGLQDFWLHVSFSKFPFFLLLPLKKKLHLKLRKLLFVFNFKELKSNFSVAVMIA